MKNFVKKGETVDVTPAAAGLSGQLLVVGAMPCVAVRDFAANETVAAMVEGVFDLPKAAVAITAGAKLYAEAGGLRVTTDDASGANPPCGFALEAAVSGASMVRVKFAI